MEAPTTPIRPAPARVLGGWWDADPASRAEIAAASYYQNGLWCGESVVKAVNEALGSPMPEGVHRMASGFCEGLGGSRCICGALAGAVMASGIVLGRSGPADAWEPSYEAAAELRRRWVERERAETCHEVAERHGGMDAPARWAHCAELVGTTARWVVELLREHGRADTATPSL
ncbi:C-GCAxxG-C-C family protein [Coriobacteriia bacterium Es71-Z0120]|uniref:C-GCAxxG-C-C family protein n=1 Tax=Parvivirga hydrogeniphila TaxID=2939460 RepID=UPI002260DA61|nr:C-GCAxxG-C-C family protein [Parvivirga hydrogeniphila]MCL4079420.1 C-GCAxxG-C-C family protein [Parvivirga hydrogeniphila]